MKKLSFLFSLVAGLLIYSSCGGDEVDLPSTDIVLSVQDAGSTAVNGATVYLFTNEDDFQSFIQLDTAVGGNPDLTLPIQTGFTVNGEINLGGLNGGGSYWFYVKKNNTNNANSQFKLNELTAGATTFVLIKLEAFVNARIQFFTRDNEVANNNIFVFANDENGRVDQTERIVISSPVINGVPSEDDPATVVFLPDFGVNTFYIKNDQGCVWAIERNITVNNPFIQIELDECNLEEITFSTDISDDITIELNNGEFIGNINNSSLSVLRPEDIDYTYKATNSTSTCSWIGTVSAGNTVLLEDSGCTIP